MTASGHLADELRRIGRRAGLDAVGICDARSFSEARVTIERQRERGWSAGMQFTYRNPARSTEPERIVPGARSLFVGARRYVRQENGHRPRDRPTGRVARYSWVDHYRPLRAALAEVADRLSGDGWAARVVADDNALVDRAAAVRAGIGWYGKNTNVLVPDAGSWFVLGSVVTDAPIAPAVPVQPVGDGCGSCHKCLVACPTGAIVGPGQLDARKCLAWLLQAPGVFPVWAREALGDRIYGCDDCQDVCPINRLAVRRYPPGRAEDGSQPWVDVVDLLQADDTALMALVGRWYIPGREPRYVRRNALIVLGNIGDARRAEVVSALQKALRHDDPIVRSHAVWAAHRLGLGHLTEPLGGDDDPMVAAELGRARQDAR